jgi:hypothetical protein
MAPNAPKAVTQAVAFGASDGFSIACKFKTHVFDTTAEKQDVHSRIQLHCASQCAFPLRVIYFHDSPGGAGLRVVAIAWQRRFAAAMRWPDRVTGAALAVVNRASQIRSASSGVSPAR